MIVELSMVCEMVKVYKQLLASRCCVYVYDMLYSFVFSPLYLSWDCSKPGVNPGLVKLMGSKVDSICMVL